MPDAWGVLAGPAGAMLGLTAHVARDVTRPAWAGPAAGAVAGVLAGEALLVLLARDEAARWVTVAFDAGAALALLAVAAARVPVRWILSGLLAGACVPAVPGAVLRAVVP